MATSRYLKITSSACIALVMTSLAACGQRPEEPKTPAAEAKAEPEPTKAPEPEPPPAAPTRPASEILGGEDKAWVFSFEGSSGYETAKSTCDERHKDDPAARARCITKARDEFTADAMEFTRDDAGNDVWVIYRTKSKKLVKVYSVKIEYGEQAGDTVSIKKVGGETGKPLLFSGVDEFKVKIGGEYSLELEDAKHGVLAYDARLGFITTQ